MFRAVTKERVASGPGKDAPGTLTNLWKKSQVKQDTDEAMEEIDLIEEPAEAMPMQADEPMPQQANNVEVEVTPDAPLTVEAGPSDAPKMVDEPIPAPEEEQTGRAPSNVVDAVAAGEKKRKRSSFSEGQVAALEALFAENATSPTDKKKAIAAQLGLEYDTVNRWLENRRRKARRSGQLAAASGAKRKAASAEQAASQAENVTGQTQPPDSKPKEEAAAPAVHDLQQAAAGAEGDAKHVDRDVAMHDAAAAGPSAHATSTDPAPPSQPRSAVTPNPSIAAEALPSPGEVAKLLASLDAEILAIRERGLAPPLTSLPLSGDVAATQQQPLSDRRLAELVVGQTLPLSALVSAVAPLFAAGSEDAPPPTAEALRCRIVDIATRKCHDPEAKAAAAAATVDGFESSIGTMWQWELREASKIFPKRAQRVEAVAVKKRGAAVGARLAAALEARALLQKVQQSTEASAGLAPKKLSKALEALSRTVSLQQIEEKATAEREAAALHAETTAREKKRAEKEAERAKKAAEKEAEKAQQAAEKEAARKKKEEEKLRLHQEKEAERERLQQEKERRAAEAEAAKLAKKTGFKDPHALNKTANKFRSFFKAPSAPQTTPVPATLNPLPANNENISPFEKRFCKPPMDHLVPQPLQPARDADIDTGLSSCISTDEAAQQWRSLLQRTKKERCEANSPRRQRDPLGLPPSWARRTGAVDIAKSRCEAMRMANFSSTLPLRFWRRKFIWHPADSGRPAYYGSWRRPGPEISGRRPFGRDPDLDYEVMSDVGWEEEPEEGDSLAGSDEEDAALDDVAPDEGEDSFMVADGYLSASEGVKLDDDEDVEDTGTGGWDACAVAMVVDLREDGVVSVRDQASGVLKEQLRRARLVGKPLIVVRADVAAFARRNEDADERGSFEEDGTTTIVGDPALLQALAMEVLLPHVSVSPAPEELGACEEPLPGSNAANKASGSAKDAGSGPGRPRAPDPDDLLPALAEYIVAHSDLTKPKLVDGFVAAHSDRKVSKKWTHEKIGELAEKVGKTYRLKHLSAASAFATPVPLGNGSHMAGPLEQLLTLKGAAKQTTQPTPVVPSALRPTEPPSAVRAPERLVTTMTDRNQAEQNSHTTAGVGAAENIGLATASPALPQLLVPDAPLDSTGDEYWSIVLQHIECDGAASFAAAFDPKALHLHAPALPAFLLSALLEAVSRHAQRVGKDDASASALTSSLCCLRNAVEALDKYEAAHGLVDGKAQTASQRAWGEQRAGPRPASILELTKEPELLPVLERCIDGGVGAGLLDALAIIGVLSQSKAAMEEDTRQALAAVGKRALKKQGPGETVNHVSAI